MQYHYQLDEMEKAAVLLNFDGLLEAHETKEPGFVKLSVVPEFDKLKEYNLRLDTLGQVFILLDLLSNHRREWRALPILRIHIADMPGAITYRQQVEKFDFEAQRSATVNL